MKVLGSLGDDKNGSLLENILRKHNIECFFNKSTKYKTTKKTRLISKSQQILRIDDEKKSTGLPESCFNKFKEIVKDVDVVLFSDYNKGSLVDLSELISITKKFDKICLVDPKSSDPFKFSGANIVTPNLNEIKNLIGSWSSETELQKKIFTLMKKAKIENIVLTRSSDGMTLYELQNMKSYNYESDVSEVYDVTGAGDSVISILSALVAIDLPLKDACTYANRGGGLIVQKFGASSLKFEEIFN